MIRRNIIAIGGAAFSDEPGSSLLDQYILKQSPKKTPNICFIPTASGDSEDYIKRFYRAFERQDCKPTHLSLFRGETPEIEKLILDQDVIFVGGGNTRNLLTLWRDWGVDRFVRKAYERGTVLAGSSAGSICWFEQGVTDSVPGSLTSLNALGWLKGSNCPHYDTEKNRRPSFHKLLKEGKIISGIATEDCVGAHYVNEELYQYVSFAEGKKAYNLTTQGPEVVEKSIEPVYLGNIDLSK